LYSLLVLVIPGWLLARGMVRRPWLSRGLPLIALAPVAAFCANELLLALPVPEVEPARLSLPERLYVALAGLPVLALPYLLAARTGRRRWLALAGLAAASLVLAAIASVVAVGLDSRDMDAAERYSWEGWALVIVIGGYLAAACVLIGKALGAAVRI